ncbi:MerR family transcriptional regulator [Dermatobacter hominis]|uniref:MerR family transcriptional regulator n=1 Tax=Dermatobacter hominis TaxID=2884263 RepID=UPI001D10B865|nr:MerR family transcriptional regulator [Dermatobacter hominis]UDY34149.1 MerR family transcriptional regulator [Dermatobacter hominis]
MAARTIGRLAEAAGVNVETIRYYERRGLIDQPERSPQGYRHYDDAALWRLSFIRRAKDLGFSLAEIAALLETDESGARSSARVLATASSRLAVVEQELADLEAVRTRLRALLDLCAGADGACLSLDSPVLRGTPTGA